MEDVQGECEVTLQKWGIFHISAVTEWTFDPLGENLESNLQPNA